MRKLVGIHFFHANRQTNPQSSRRFAIQNFFPSALKNRLLPEIEPVLSISNFNHSFNRDIPPQLFLYVLKTQIHQTAEESTKLLVRVSLVLTLNKRFHLSSLPRKLYALHAALSTKKGKFCGANNINKSVCSSVSFQLTVSASALVFFFSSRWHLSEF
jgi:hypothetical protein